MMTDYNKIIIISSNKNEQLIAIWDSYKEIYGRQRIAILQFISLNEI